MSTVFVASLYLREAAALLLTLPSSLLRALKGSNSPAPPGPASHSRGPQSPYPNRPPRSAGGARKKGRNDPSTIAWRFLGSSLACAYSFWLLSSVLQGAFGVRGHLE